MFFRDHTLGLVVLESVSVVVFESVQIGEQGMSTGFLSMHALHPNLDLKQSLSSRESLSSTAGVTGPLQRISDAPKSANESVFDAHKIHVDSKIVGHRYLGTAHISIIASSAHVPFEDSSYLVRFQCADLGR